MFLESLIIAMIASFFIGFKDKKVDLTKTLTYYGITTILLTIVIYIGLYFATPAFVGLFGGYYRVAIVPILVVSILYLILSSSEGNIYEIIIQALKIIIVLSISLYIMISPIIYNQQLHDIPDVKVYNNVSEGSNFAPIDAQNMRIVDQSMAYYLGNKVIGSSEQNLGSQYEVKQEDFTIQNVNGRLYWVAPLEFRDMIKWWTVKTSPGYIMVDAEDPTVPAKLYTNYKMKYMTSSYFGDYIIRHLYVNGYQNVKLKDINFEITDKLEPKWVVSLTTPSVVNDGDKLLGVAVIDPVSGKIEQYSVKNIPSWIDRVMPESLAHDYLTWYGSYVHGWINSMTTEQDVNVVSSDEMWFIHGKNGQGYWFAGMTSPSSNDQSLTSIALVDSKTGEVNMYKISGWNEAAVTNAVNVAVSNYKNYEGCSPIPYDCSGRLAYVVPVAADSGAGKIFQEVGIVDAITGHVSLGSTKAVAFEAYRRYLNDNGYNFAITDSRIIKNICGSVGRISNIVSSNNLNYRMMYLNNSNIIYEVPISQYPEAAITNIGDVVNMTYEDTNDSIITVDKFDNIVINTRISSEQKNYTQNSTAY